MFELRLSKVPVSGTNMNTDVFVIVHAIEGYGFGAYEVSRDGDSARIRVFQHGEHPFQCVLVYHIREKSVVFEEGDKDAVSLLKLRICVL